MDIFTRLITIQVVGPAVVGDSRKRNVISAFAAKIQASVQGAISDPVAVGNITADSVIATRMIVREPEAPAEAYGSATENICPDSTAKAVTGPRIDPPPAPP